MKNLSLKLSENIFHETEIMVKKVRKPRNRYINEAINFYNNYQKKKLIMKQLESESKMVEKSSKEVLKELEKLEE